MRYFIELAYNGGDFHGWQIQTNAISVQQCLEEALSKVLQEEVSITGCGRTDSGVHASQFFAHFDTDTEFDAEKTTFSLNNMLGKSIALKRIYPVDDELHARFSATARTYQYFIHYSKNPFISGNSVFIQKKLDIDLMNQACKMLFKHEDFTSFSKVNTDTKTNNCQIMEATWKPFGDGIVFEIKANRFLRNMVRAIVGTMFEVGLGKMTVEEFNSVISKRDRGAAGASAPAHGLFLYKIEYP